MPVRSIEQKFTDALTPYIEPDKAAQLPRFFQVRPGGYGEGDCFLGVRVPHIRRVAKTFYRIGYEEIGCLLASRWHEVRLGALFILVHRFKKAPDAALELYLANLDRINNWDLVDSSAHQILGQWLLSRDDRSFLFALAGSSNLWERRIAIMATFALIKQGRFDLTISLAKTLLHDSHDLIHKAVGWMLREVGNRDRQTLETFLDRHAALMPRTMLRYAIEKLPQEKRKIYLAMKKSI